MEAGYFAAAIFLVTSGGGSLAQVLKLGSRTIDSSPACVSLFLFYGKLKQAKTMFKSQRAQAVSWLRGLGLVVKDVSGLWYTLSVGHELIWLSLTHLLSGVSSSLICAAKWRVERNLLRKPLSAGEL